MYTSDKLVTSDTAGEQYSTVLWRFYLFISLSLVSMAHDLFWYSGMVPWQPYQQLELRDLAIKGLIYTLLYLFFIPPATSIASLFAYATVISLFSKIFSLTSNIFRHEDVSAVYLQHALSTYCLFQKICAFKLVEWIGSDCV